MLFLMVVAGNAADRYPRRNIGIFAHSLLTLAAAGLALVRGSNGPTWVIYSLLALVGTARAFSSPSVNTILPQLLAPAEFANANAWLSSDVSARGDHRPGRWRNADRGHRRRDGWRLRLPRSGS